MSDFYHIGSIGNIYNVNKYIEMAGSTERIVRHYLESLGIKVMEDFNWFNGDNKEWLLFYKISKWDLEMCESSMFCDEADFREEVEADELPKVFDDKLDSKTDYYYKINKNELSKPSTAILKKLKSVEKPITKDELKKALEETDYTSREINDLDLEELNNIVMKIIEWITYNQYIYWWKYY